MKLPEVEYLHASMAFSGYTPCLIMRWDGDCITILYWDWYILDYVECVTHESRLRFL